MEKKMAFTLVNNENSRNLHDVYFRVPRKGPETELVDVFLDKLRITGLKGDDVVVFQEPRIESGFPDIVIVITSRKTASAWPEARLSLTPFDMRLIHHISENGYCEESELLELFGNGFRDSIDRLHKAKMVRKRGHIWENYSINKIYAVKSIISIEVKIEKTKQALHQAFLNKWFTDKSYVALPRLPRCSHLIETAKKYGVGFCTPEDCVFNLHDRRTSNNPRSYASWLFNEWAWRTCQ